jgi:hypothetical protein
MHIQFMLYFLNKFLLVVLTVVEHINSRVRPQIIPSPKSVGRDWVHSTLKANSLCRVILNGVNFVVSVSRLDNTVDLDQVNIESNV